MKYKEELIECPECDDGTMILSTEADAGNGNTTYVAYCKKCDYTDYEYYQK